MTLRCNAHSERYFQNLIIATTAMSPLRSYPQLTPVGPSGTSRGKFSGSESWYKWLHPKGFAMC